MIVIVSNLARAGSSLCMQMLHAGGYPCLGRAPAFEVSLDDPREWISNCNGMALKVIDPHHYPPPPGPEYRVIWIDRDIREQAKSTIKAMRAFGQSAHKSLRHDMERLIQEQRRPALETWAGLGAKMLMLRYERLKRDTRAQAERIAEFVGGGLDVDAMTTACVNRRADCLPYMLEFDLLEAR